MRPRGKRSKPSRRQNPKKKSHGGKASRKKKINLRSLQAESREHPKRDHEADDDCNLKAKRQKVEETRLQVEDDPSSAEEEDHLKQLLDTFGSDFSSKQSVAIDSSEDSLSSDDDENNSNDQNLNSDLTSVEQDQLQEEDEVDVETQKEDEDFSNINDPFARHLFYDLSESLLNSVQNTPMSVTDHYEDWPTLGKLHIQIPKCEEVSIRPVKFSIAEEKPFAARGEIPSRINFKKHTLSSAYVKTQIVNNLNKDDVPFTAFQREFFSIVNNYQDFYYTHRSFENAEEIRFVYSLHVVNHILKTRTKVLHHNAKLTKKNDVPDEFRDQGLVRPKVLMIVPFRDAAYRIITMLIDILLKEDKGNVINKSRFIEEFTGHEIVMPKKNPKPEDYEMLFRGNTGDDFRIGITITKKSLKLFADFYSSDIIIASPLGLRTIIGADGEDRDYDFLASIELLIIDQAEIFLMQNWDHLLHALSHLHLQPKESHGTDFSRVRTWSLNGWAKYYRQTLIFSSSVLPEINAIFNKKCCNYSGKVKTVNPVTLGAICQVVVQLPHVFHKFGAENAAELPEARFKFFVGKILPQQKEALMRQTVIFVSNYFDYVRLRNYFKKDDIGFVQICEYSKEGKVARARDMFFHGDAHFLLYTERYHFFNRVRIKGIRHLIFYQPPYFSHFYSEICNLMQDTNMNRKVGNVSNMTVTVLYSKYDINQLASIVGTERAARMVQSERNVHMLVTDGK